MFYMYVKVALAVLPMERVSDWAKGRGPWGPIFPKMFYMFPLWRARMSFRVLSLPLLLLLLTTSCWLGLGQSPCLLVWTARVPLGRYTCCYSSQLSLVPMPFSGFDLRSSVGCGFGSVTRVTSFVLRLRGRLFYLRLVLNLLFTNLCLDAPCCRDAARFSSLVLLLCCSVLACLEHLRVRTCSCKNADSADSDILTKFNTGLMAQWMLLSKNTV